MRNNRAITIAALAALPMALLEAWSLVMAFTEFSHGGADAKALVLLALVQGGIPIAISLGVMGAGDRKRGGSVGIGLRAVAFKRPAAVWGVSGGGAVRCRSGGLVAGTGGGEAGAK
ncbi:MAG: hypothetical protein ABSC05_05840 [Candidatus Solibacter sp.]|jgi:hypothetical protein